MAGTVIADRLEAASTSQLVIENGVALTPPTIVDVNNVQIGTFCRAWVNFTGGTVAIRGSFNVSSVTDNGVGDYIVNFTNAMQDVNYAANLSIESSNANYTSRVRDGTFATGSVRVNCGSPTSGGTLTDVTAVCVSIFR